MTDEARINLPAGHQLIIPPSSVTAPARIVFEIRRAEYLIAEIRAVVDVPNDVEDPKYAFNGPDYPSLVLNTASCPGFAGNGPLVKVGTVVDVIPPLSVQGPRHTYAIEHLSIFLLASP